MRRLWWVLVLVVACGRTPVDLSVQAPATLHLEPRGHEDARVVRAVDGDTIEVEVIGRVDGPGAGRAEPGGIYDVRLIGVDTPESVSPRDPVECFGPEASAAAAALLEGATVRMVRDVEEQDSFGRLLRYVYLGAELANARLVANGYARAYEYPPNVRHSTLFVGLEREASQRDRGLWAPSACDGESLDPSG
ncbi:MAG: thermonuclease family protein [Actinomycetota bacterium]|nr:thermonuclease family protein [Actinomycetota bacterium]